MNKKIGLILSVVLCIVSFSYSMDQRGRELAEVYRRIVMRLTFIGRGELADIMRNPVVNLNKGKYKNFDAWGFKSDKGFVFIALINPNTDFTRICVNPDLVPVDTAKEADVRKTFAKVSKTFNGPVYSRELGIFYPPRQ